MKKSDTLPVEGGRMCLEREGAVAGCGLPLQVLLDQNRKPYIEFIYDFHAKLIFVFSKSF